MEPGLNMLQNAMTLKLHATDVIANNIANGNTTGFKQSSISTKTAFSDEINAQIKDEVARKETALNSTIPKLSSSNIDPTAGAIQITQNQYDFALKEANMMFMVQLQNGDVGYTRDGSFKVLENNIVTGDGQLVLGAGGGAIEIENGKIPTLGVVEVDFKNIQPLGGNIYRLKDPENLPQEVPDPTNFIMQGALESSNVNIVKSMTDLIEAHRGFEQLSKLMHGIDEINKQAASEVGNVRA